MTSSEERCAIMDTEIFECTDTCEYPDGNWVVVPCTETHPYMCKSKKGMIFIFMLINLKLLNRMFKCNRLLMFNQINNLNR